MEIKLTPEEEQAVRETAANMAATKCISEEQAIKDLLGMGLNAWWGMQEVAKLNEIAAQNTERRRQEYLRTHC